MPSLWKWGILILGFLGQSTDAHFPVTNPQLEANQLARAVFHNEITAQDRDQSLWCYHQLKEESGKKKLFEVCQTKDGEIARLLEVNGQALSPKQRQAEDQRIQKLVNHAELMHQERKKQQEDSKQAEDMMKLFSQAFRFQYEGTDGDLVRLKFTPNPDFHPSGRPAQVLHHLEGHILVDRQQERLAEINGQLTSDVKFGWGLLGHLDEGGTFLVKQQDLGAGHWEMTTMDVEMNGKVLFFKTIAVQEKETDFDFQQAPGGMSAMQAFEFLRQAGVPEAPAKKSAPKTERSGARRLNPHSC